MTTQERRYALNKRISTKHLKWAQESCKTTDWTPEQIEEHLAKIGPDKHFDSYHERSGSKMIIYGAQQKRHADGHYSKKGGESW